jgi:hypothetical protein
MAHGLYLMNPVSAVENVVAMQMETIRLGVLAVELTFMVTVVCL